MAKKNFGEGPIKSVQEWAEEQLSFDDYEKFLLDVTKGDENGDNKYKITDKISLEKFEDLKKIHGFLP